MDHKLIAAAVAGASRGIIEYELRTWPIAAAGASLGLSLAIHALPDRPGILIASAAAMALIAIVLASQLDQGGIGSSGRRMLHN